MGDRNGKLCHLREVNDAFTLAIRRRPANWFWGRNR
jgi:hypothetical protein